MGKSKEFSKKFWNVIDKGLSGWSILLMGLMASLVVISVILRYVFNLTYVWSEELIIYLFVATTYFGSIICVKEKEHIDIPFLRDLASKDVGLVMDIGVCLINLAVQLGLAYFSFTWMEKTGSSLTTGLLIPLYVVYSIFPICFFLMAVYTVRRMDTCIIPADRETKHAKAVKIIVDIVMSLIYIGLIGGLYYLYSTINWSERIQAAFNKGMMIQINVLFHILFILFGAVLVYYLAKRITYIFKDNRVIEEGGKQ